MRTAPFGEDSRSVVTRAALSIERLVYSRLEKESEDYVALCPELVVASQGTSVENAMANLREAVELFLECASRDEVESRLHDEVFVTRFEAAYA